MDYVQFETEEGWIALHPKFFRKGYEETEDDLCLPMPSKKEIQDAINLSKKLVQGELKEDMAEVKRPADLIPQCEFPRYVSVPCGFLRRGVIVAATLGITVGLNYGVALFTNMMRQSTVCSEKEWRAEDLSVTQNLMDMIGSFVGRESKRVKVCALKDKEFEGYYAIIEQVRKALLGGSGLGGTAGLISAQWLDCQLAPYVEDCRRSCQRTTPMQIEEE